MLSHVGKVGSSDDVTTDQSSSVSDIESFRQQTRAWLLLYAAVTVPALVAAVAAGWGRAVD